MKPEHIALIQERESLINRLNWLGLRSTGSEKIEARIALINTELDRLQKQGA